MKKLFALLSALALCLSLAACGGEDDDPRDVVGGDWRVTGIVRDGGTITRDGEDTDVLVCVHADSADFYLDDEVQTLYDSVRHPITLQGDPWEAFQGIDFADRNGDGSSDAAMLFELDGQQVLDYCRARKGYGTDVDRADRQQRMLFAIFTQLREGSRLTSIPKLYLSVKDYIYTDLTAEQIAALAVFGMDLVPGESLVRHTLKGKYISGTAYNGASFYVLDTRALKSLMKDIFGVDIKVDYRYDYRYIQDKKS